MLTSLLPGFRHLRAPFAAGCLILASLYLWFGSSIDRAVNGDPQYGERIERVTSVVGQAGWNVVGLVAAYVIGSLYILAREFVVYHRARRVIDGLTEPSDIDSGRGQFFGTNLRYLRSPISAPALRRLIELARQFHPADMSDFEKGVQLVRDILNERGKRLVSHNKERFEVYDRLMAESEFRDALLLPGLIACAAILFDLDVGLPVKTLGLASLLLLAAVLYVHARVLEREANSVHAYAVAEGEGGTSSIDRWSVDA